MIFIPEEQLLLASDDTSTEDDGDDESERRSLSESLKLSQLKELAAANVDEAQTASSPELGLTP